jgi:5-methylcytosine-specific restriction endonuclease McrA
MGGHLLTRDEFRVGVFARDGKTCVACGKPGQDAHHIIERRLWPDGGYYLDTKLNGRGCDYVTTAHAKSYYDYSTGFRCCW